MKSKDQFFKILVFVFLLSFLWPLFSQIKDQDKNLHNAYVIGAKDLLSITVFGAPELNTRARISERGEITLPLVGTIKIDGLSRSDAEKKIETLLGEKYLRNAKVSIFIEEYRSRMVSVIGSVATSGDLELVGPQTLLQIISRAGGLTESNAGRVILLRDKNGKKTSRVIDIHKLMTYGNSDLNVKIYPGDIINIPRISYLNVYIFGQVRNPGNHRLRVNGMGVTILKAIAQAGGFTERARKGKVLITRTTELGQQKINVNVKKILKGKKKDFILEQDDIIYIPESLF